MKGNDALDADIYFGNEVLFDIPIDIDIPKNGFGEILVRINSDNKELHKMAGHGSFTFLVKRYTIDHNLVGTIKSEGVRIYNRTFNTTGIKNTIIIEGRADHLLYKNFRGVVDSNSHVVGDFMSENVDELTFYLSNSSIVLPRIRPHVDFHGNVKIDKSQFKEFITPCGKEIKFEKYYKYKEHDGTIELHPYQVAIIKSISGEPVSLGGEKSTFIDVIESTLQLVSFVEGRRVAWSSWEYKCKDMMVKYLRGNVLSSTEETYSVDDAIIDKKYLNEFLRKTFYNFHCGNYKSAIIGAIGSLNSVKTMPVETYFMSLFQSLESIVLTYRKMNGTEFVLDKKEWSLIKGVIEGAIRNNKELMLAKSNRAQLYCKLNDLNRIPFQKAFIDFSSEINFLSSSPWPLFKNEDKIGLVSIRNMLAHGDYFPDELLNPLFVAGECLKLILQEIIFKVIGWELSKKNNVAEAKPNVKFYPEYINECIGMMTNHITKRN